MNKYLRWIIFGVVAVVLLALLLLVGANKQLRQQIQSLLLERFIKNKVRDLQDKAAVAKAKADTGTASAEHAEKIAKETEEAINKQKEQLQSHFEGRGMSADEISDRFNNLRI